jgi:DNA-binding transcriptional LysR family regulator
MADSEWIDRTGRRIKLRDLQMLQAVVQAGSMAKAAVTLAVTQPAVSYAIRELEQALAVPLLDRSSQGVTPTVYGRALLERSAIIFNELRQGICDVASLADPSAGEVRIGTTAPMSAVASAAINRLAPRYPRMVFDLHVEPTQLLLQALRRRDIELMISRLGDNQDTDDLDVAPLFDDELAVVCGKENPWARRRNVTLAALTGEPWVLPPESGFLTHVIRAAFAAKGLAMPRATVTTASTHALSVLVTNGPFLAMHPRTMLVLPRPHPQLSAVDLRLPATRASISLITLRNRSLSPAAGLFRKAVQEVTATHRTPGRSRTRGARPDAIRRQ